MRKEKQKALRWLSLAVISFFIHACSVFLEPFAVNADNEVTVAGYVLGGIFWVSLIVGGVFFWLCWKTIASHDGYRQWKEKKIIGIFGFFRTNAAKIMDPVLLLSLAITITGILTGKMPDGLLLVVIAIVLFTFYLHMIVNGRVYRYMTLSERKEKKGEKERN